MNILLATPMYPPTIGGPATYAKVFEEGFAEKGHMVRVVSFDSVGRLLIGVRHVALFVRLVRHAWWADVVLVQDTVSTGVPAMLAARVTRTPLVVRVPGDYAWEQGVQRFGVTDTIDTFQAKRYGLRVEFLRYLQCSVVRSARAVIAPSEYFKSLVQGWVRSQSNVVRIYNGVDLSHLPEVTTRRERTIISAGRLVPWKGFQALIDVIGRMQGWQLRIAGDGPERAALEAHASSAGVSDRVVFLGRIPRGELLAELGNAEVFVLNTSFESFSFQIVEAMAMGVPIVTTNIGNIGELIETGVHGVLVTPDDTDAIYEAILAVHDDSEYAARLARAAKDRAVVFREDIMIQKTEELLARVVTATKTL